MDAPIAVEKLISSWKQDGCPSQRGIAWPRQRWISQLPEHTDVFNSLPERLNREAVRAACIDACSSSERAISAFVAVMAWGYGRVGYGPWRIRIALELDAAADRLLAVARCLSMEGPLAAYGGFSSSSRLPRIGPAFGTKFLHFCPQAPAKQPAVIFDRLVARWMKENVGVSLNPVPWAPRTYERYLDHLESWASALSVSPIDIEERIFVAEATRAGGQWTVG
jgi:hypothetical protein